LPQAVAQKISQSEETCAALFDAVSSASGSNPTAAPSDTALQSALALCESYLFHDPSARKAASSGTLLDALAQTTPKLDEASAYAGLLTRFAAADGVRRWLYFAPRLQKFFQGLYARRGANAGCDRTAREFAHFLLAAPKPLGGDTARGTAMIKGDCGATNSPPVAVR
jgi:hypothetical protein